MTAQELLRQAVDLLRRNAIPDPQRDARLMLAHAMDIASDRMTLHLHDVPDDAATARFRAALDRRCDRQPVAQILGRRQFYGRSFRVTPDVLDPRAETETLVALALAEPFERVLDLGTGSGCILLSLLAEAPDATGLGVDLSPAALRVARANADALDLARRAELRVSDWLAQVSGQFDLIVANPPYVTAAEFDALDPEPRLWEPRAALTPGGDGLDAYRVIARDVAPFLRPGGRLLLEIGPAQGAAVRDLLERAGLRGARVAQDLDGRDRVVHLHR